MSSPDGPPSLGARLCHLLGVTIPILPIFTSHIVDSFLPIACCRLQSSILSKIRPPEESLHQTCRAFRAEFDSREPIEIYPDKKTRVGSLRTPREYDGRLPLDVDSYLNLVIPRIEEPPKKIGSHVRLLHGRVMQIKRAIASQPIPEYQ